MVEQKKIYNQTIDLPIPVNFSAGKMLSSCSCHVVFRFDIYGAVRVERAKELKGLEVTSIYKINKTQGAR